MNGLYEIVHRLYQYDNKVEVTKAISNGERWEIECHFIKSVDNELRTITSRLDGFDKEKSYVVTSALYADDTWHLLVTEGAENAGN